MRQNNKGPVYDILAHLTGAAAAAADGMTDAVHTAGQIVGEKYDVIRLNIDLSKLQDEQNKLFVALGRMLYSLQSEAGEQAGDEGDKAVLDAQQTVDRLLLLVDQKQQEIDLVAKKLHRLNGSELCHICGKVCHVKDSFCPGCGAKLP